MKNINENYGKNAGKIWETLNKHGPLTENKLQKITNLKNGDLHSAIGWLARENKIFKNNSNYSLGETNLTETIGANAGKVWETLSNWTESDINNILNLLKIDKKDVYSALGWLAREDKLEITTNRNNSVKLKLK